MRSISHRSCGALDAARMNTRRLVARSKMSGCAISALVPLVCTGDKAGMAKVFALLRLFVDFALPPRCAGCGVIVGEDRQLCVTCWETMNFITGVGCSLCGCPSVTDSLTCAPCLKQPPDHDGVRAAVVYGDLARAIILRFKHGGRTGLASLIALAIARHVPEGPGLLVPVPLHRWRLWKRGFNQSVLLARRVAAISGHECANELLVRNKRTPILGGLGAKARAEAVRRVFSVRPEMAGSLKDKTIFLVDDVYTSGATANACARALKKAGADRVVVLCWARVMISD